MARTKQVEDENPIMAAEQALADAQQAAADAQQRRADLEQKLLDHGHLAVTAEELGKAIHEAEHAELGLKAAQLALEGAHRAARLQLLEGIADEISRDAGEHAAIMAAFNKVTEGAAELLAIDDGRSTYIHQWIGRLQAAGVPKLDKYDKVRQLPDGTLSKPYNHVSEEHAFLGWEVKDGPWNANAVTVGDRRIKAHPHGLLLAAAVVRAAKQAGIPLRLLDDVMQIKLGNNDDPLVNNPDQWIAANY